MADDAIIPGFTADQSWAIEQVLSRAVEKGVAAGIEAFQKANCSEHEKRTLALEDTVFGRAERNVVGHVQRLALAEKAILAIAGDLRWLKRTVAGAVVVGGVTFAIWALEALLRAHH
jgi:hypothetical protein